MLLVCNRTGCAFCYYGVVLMTTELFEASETCSKSQGMFQMVETCSADCRKLTTQDYMDLLWTTLAEFPGTCEIFFFLVEYTLKGAVW